MAKTEEEAEIVREYGPFPGVTDVAGVSFDGRQVWFAAGETIRSFDPATGESGRTLDVTGDAGTAFDGKYLWQIADARIQKVDPSTGKVLSTIPAPGGGRDSGLAWAEGTLWVGEYRERKIHQIDPETGKVRFVPVIRFYNHRVQKRWGEVVLAAVREDHPEALS